MSLLSRLAVQAARAYGILSAADKTKVAASYLVVAGGAGGGTNAGGGGGAGGYQASTFTLSTLNTYSITVGAGGSGGASGGNNAGSNGSNSVVSGTGLTTLTSVGGGGGGKEGSPPDGNSGGSGGGGHSNGATIGTGGAGTSGQGNAGGSGATNNSTYRNGGGGGGAGAVGATATSGGGGAGGNGSASSISGSSVTYAGGGGGGSQTVSAGGAGGTGGGGAGTGGTGGAAGTSGTTNLGGGGGGGAGGLGAGGSGGSGIVIISYASATPKFVGGTLTTSGGNQIHTFTSSGTLSPLTPVTASYLVVAGGGGGGTGTSGGQGGGGAGGLLTSSTTLYSGATYIVTVGGGGAQGVNGSNSVLSGTGLTTITSTGGGLGASGSFGTGGSGGSGGGGSEGNNPSDGGNGGAGTSGQGSNGGKGAGGAGGGGGGAGAVGAAAAGSGGVGVDPGDGGIGVQSSITGTATYYAGGGGGSGYGPYTPSTTGTGGSGGGGTGASGQNGSVATPGTPNTGGGGGAKNTSGSGSAAGGSGVVIISYAGSQVFNGGLVTSSGGNTIHTFTATGALTPLTNNLTNSLRFRSSASAYLNRTPTSSGNRQKWTWSAWLKRGSITSATQQIMAAGDGTVNNRFLLAFLTSTDTLSIQNSISGTNTVIRTTTQVFRDPSAWYHIVLAIDTTQATAANRTKLYINGNEVTSFGTSNDLTLNYDTYFNSTSYSNTIGVSSTSYFDGYLTDINFIDGQALEPYYFGNNDANGVWKPIKYTGTYGTNGFYLTFGNTTSTTTLGNDSSGNGNNWTTNNISLTAGVTYDAMTDVPTNTSATVANYAVMNPLELGDGAPAALSNGNLTITGSSTLYLRRGTMNFPLTGKYYCEFTVTAVGSGVSIAYDSRGQSGATQFIQYDNGGTKNINGTSTSYGASFTTGDIVAMAVDADGGSIAFYKNNTSQGSITFSSASMTGVNATAMVFAFTSAIVNANFGQRPFSYTPPTGFVALNTFNLPTPTILQGNKYMDATLYTGNGSTQVLVNQGQFKPDFVWVKARSATYNHTLYDSIRGVHNYLISNLTNAAASSSDTLQAFNSNGFTVGTNQGLNENASTYVGWQWQAGQGSTSSNTSGSITSTVSVNTTSGFSIVTYTGNGTAGATVGHGLGVAPKMFIVKNRVQGTYGNWNVWHTTLTGSQYLTLNTTEAAGTNNNRWNGTVPTPTVFSLGADSFGNTNKSGDTYVAYCWAEISGYSKAFSYTGNASTDGPFVFCNFRPRFILFKNSSAVTVWIIFDTARNTYNFVDAQLRPNESSAENSAGSAYSMDILSNGFKVRSADSNFNGSGNTIIGMAFASNPFKNSTAV